MWIEIHQKGKKFYTRASRPARALWIEMHGIWKPIPDRAVEAREGLVD